MAAAVAGVRIVDYNVFCFAHNTKTHPCELSDGASNKKASAALDAVLLLAAARDGAECVGVVCRGTRAQHLIWNKLSVRLEIKQLSRLGLPTLNQRHPRFSLLLGSLAFTPSTRKPGGAAFLLFVAAIDVLAASHSWGYLLSFGAFYNLCVKHQLGLLAPLVSARTLGTGIGTPLNSLLIKQLTSLHRKVYCKVTRVLTWFQTAPSMTPHAIRKRRCWAGLPSLASLRPPKLKVKRDRAGTYATRFPTLVKGFAQLRKALIDEHKRKSAWASNHPEFVSSTYWDYLYIPLCVQATRQIDLDNGERPALVRHTTCGVEMEFDRVVVGEHNLLIPKSCAMCVAELTRKTLDVIANPSMSSFARFSRAQEVRGAVATSQLAGRT